jgi:hypothetical protein
MHQAGYLQLSGKGRWNHVVPKSTRSSKPCKPLFIKHTPASENVQRIKNKGEFKGHQISTTKSQKLSISPTNRL